MKINEFNIKGYDKQEMSDGQFVEEMEYLNEIPKIRK